MTQAKRARKTQAEKEEAPQEEVNLDEGAPALETPESPAEAPAESDHRGAIEFATVSDVEAQQAALVKSDDDEDQVDAPDDYGVGSVPAARPWVFAPPPGS